MFSIFVVLSIVFERAATWIGFFRTLVRIEASPRYRRVARAFLAIPFAVYPIALVSLSLAFSFLVDRAYAAEGRVAGGYGLPYDFLYLHDPLWSVPYHRIATPLLADVFAQSLILAAVYTYARARSLSRLDLVVVSASVAALAVTAMGRHLLESTDLYNYIVYARAGMADSYAGAVTNDPGLRHVLTLNWGAALPPSPYGPLWQAYNHAIVGTANVAEAAFRLRCFNLVVLFALFGGLLAARVPRAGVLVLVLNPFLYQQFVANAHNDILPIAALALAVVWASGRPWLPIVATIFAGLVKLPLLAVGIAALGSIASLRFRMLASAGVLIAVAALSYGLGGPAYVHALLFSEREHASIRQIVIAIVAIVAIAIACLARRAYWPGLLAIPAIRSFQYSWYLGWLVPLAFVQRAAVSPIAILFPILGFLLSADVFATPRIVRITAYAVLVVGLTIAILHARRTSDEKAAAAQRTVLATAVAPAALR